MEETLSLDIQFWVHLASVNEVIHPQGNATVVLVEMPIKHMAQSLFFMLPKLMLLSDVGCQMVKVWVMTFFK